MKTSWLDLRSHVDLESFPIEEALLGMAKSSKGVSTFYGDKHHGNYDPEKFGDRTTYRWYNALKTDSPIESFVVGLNYFFGDYWWARFGEPVWKPTANMAHFPLLQQWLVDQDIFSSIGRQTFFLNLPGQTEIA